jgi:hypothetical protein
VRKIGKGPDNLNIVSAPNFWDFERQSRSFEALDIFHSAGRGYNFWAAGTRQQAGQVSGLRISAGYFKVLGVKPILGRTFLREEETLGRDHEVGFELRSLEDALEWPSLAHR